MKRRAWTSSAVMAAAAAAIATGGPMMSTRAAAPAAADPVTFSEHIAPIVYANCTTCHHPGEAVPFTLTNYDEVKRRGKTIVAATERRYMPPWHGASEMGHFRDERGLTDAQIKLIKTWVDNGMPSGDLAKAPKPPQFPEGWRLGPPDLVVKMDRAIEVPADGPDVFRNYAIKLNLKEDKWVRAIDFKPSARVSHHALFFLDSSGEAMRLQSQETTPGFGDMSFVAGAIAGRLLAALGRGNGGNRGGGTGADVVALGGWAVGGTPTPLPDGLAKALPAGSDFVMQMHFHPTGKVEQEQASIGFYFADKPPVKTLVALQMPPLFGRLAGIDIPPGVKDYTIGDTFTVPIDMDIISMGAHAHYLAKYMKMTATLPGENKPRVLAAVPKWDFNWQERYVFKEAIHLPRGTRLDVEILYDNSKDNPNNPHNPPQRVRYGQQSFDEMGAVTLEVVAAREQELPAFQTAQLAHVVELAVLNGGRGGGGLLGNRGR